MAAASAILNPRSGLEARSRGVDLPQGASLVPKLNFGYGPLTSLALIGRQGSLPLPHRLPQSFRLWRA